MYPILKIKKIICNDICTSVFTVVLLFMVAKTWKQSQCPSIDDWYIYTMEFYSAIRKDEILPFATPWMGLETIMLSEISQYEKEPYDFTHVWDIKLKLIDTDNSMVVPEERGVEGSKW